MVVWKYQFITVKLGTPRIDKFLIVVTSQNLATSVAKARWKNLSVITSSSEKPNHNNGKTID